MDRSVARQELAKRLRTARHNAGFGSAARAAEALEIAYPTYAGYENGTRGLKPDLVLRMSRLFGVSDRWLQYGISDANVTEAATVPSAAGPAGGVLDRLVAERAEAAERMATAAREVAALDAAIAMLRPDEAA